MSYFWTILLTKAFNGTVAHFMLWNILLGVLEKHASAIITINVIIITIFIIINVLWRKRVNWMTADFWTLLQVHSSLGASNADSWRSIGNTYQKHL